MTVGGRHADRRASGTPGWLLGLISLMLIAGAAFARAANLPVSPATLAVTTVPATHPQVVTAGIDHRPGRLRKGISGFPFAAEIELPGDLDPATIVAGTVHLCLGTDPCGSGGVPGTHPTLRTRHGRHELTVRFDRGAVNALLTGVRPPATVAFTVSGAFGSGAFSGSDRIHVVGPG